MPRAKRPGLRCLSACWFLIWAGVLGAPAVQAHQQSATFGQIARAGKADDGGELISWRLRVRVSDLNLALSDANWSRQRAESYLRSGLHVASGAEPCSPAGSTLASDPSETEPTLVFVQRYRCPARGGPLRFRYELFFESDRFHQSFTRLTLAADRARPLFESALARLPGYAAAAGHLAHLLAAFGDPEGRERARLLLESLVARTDDPEYVGQLGALYRQMHRTEEGDRLVRSATSGYEALLARHPAAFCDHAARFYLHVAGDPDRALVLARKNLALRQTPDARDLVTEAERATTATASFLPRGEAQKISPAAK